MMSQVNITPVYLYPHNAANEPVVLHQGTVTLLWDNKTLHGEGALSLRWFPATDIRLTIEIPSAAAPKTGEEIRVQIGNALANALVFSSSLEITEAASLTKITASISFLEDSSAVQIQAIDFQVVNFPDFLAQREEVGPTFGFPPRAIDLEADDWRIRLTAIQHADSVFKDLKSSGGYAFTHLGRLERKDGALFSTADAKETIKALGAFLSFARGAACSLPIRWEVDVHNNTVGRYWGAPIVEPWKGIQSWFCIRNGNILSEIFPGFIQVYNDPQLNEAFKLALHWYQKCNTQGGGLEAAIILGLTALDLLGALIVVDKTSKMSAEKYDKLSAAEKIKVLLQTIGVGTEIPPLLNALAEFSLSNDWPDGAVALAEIRHGYVHPKPQRRKIVLNSPKGVTFQTWWLALWYQEISLLYLLDYKGKYVNRLTAEWVGQVEEVPWVANK